MTLTSDTHVHVLSEVVAVEAALMLEEARDHARTWLRPSLLRRVLRKASGTRAIHPLDDRAIETFASQAVYSPEKAATLLGFRPRCDLENGMRMYDHRQQWVQNKWTLSY